MRAKKIKSKVLVIGAGTWGTAIANHLALNNNQVILNSIENEVIEEINHTHKNSKYLPNIDLHHNLSASADFVNDVNFVFIVVPSDICGAIFKKIASYNFIHNPIFIICSKGFEHEKIRLLSDAFDEITNNKNYVVLSGPNFAIEVAKETPSITTIASYNKKNAAKVIKILNNKNFAASYFKDPKTAEISGIIKNILAIGCGIIDGLELGVNTKSALLVKGIKEIQLLCKAIKCSSDLANGAGFGDIFLTCSSTKSRNNSLGVCLAKGIEADKNLTFEGANSAKIIVLFAQKYNIKLDLCEVLSKIINNRYSKEQISSLLIPIILQ